MGGNDCISVIIPVYKVEKYLSKCIRSVIEQTYKNLDIILVDDGSPDNCGDICDRFAMQDSRIRVIHKENGGLSDARNAGMRIARGDYYTFVDSDDWLETDFCELCLKKSKEHDAEIVAVSLKSVDEEGRVISSDARETETVYSNKEALAAMFNPKLIRWCAQAKLYKSELFDGIEYPLGKTMEDKATTYKLFAKSNKIVFWDVYKYNYLIRQGSIMRTSFSEKDKDAYCIQKELNSFLENNFPDASADSHAHTVRVAIILLSKMMETDKVDTVFGEMLFSDMKQYSKSFFKGKAIDWRYKPVGKLYLLLHGIFAENIYTKSKMFNIICHAVARKMA